MADNSEATATGKKYDFDTAIFIAKRIFVDLAPFTERIAIVGSLRRRKDRVKDIEILAVPKLRAGGLFKTVPESLLEFAVDNYLKTGIMKPRLNKLGRQSLGKQNKLLVCYGMPLDLFITDEERWAVAMVVRTGSKDSNIRIARAAQDKDWEFKAYGAGFKTPDGIRKCATEREVFEAVGLKYLKPEERNIEFG